MNLNYLNYVTFGVKTVVLLSIIIVSYLIASSPLIARWEITYAVTIDLIFSLPILYLFFIWKTKINKLTVIPLFVFSIIFGSYILPTDNQYLLNILKLFTIPVVELASLIFIGRLIYKSHKAYLHNGLHCTDVLENLRETLAREFPIPMFGKVLGFEIAGIYYAIIGWKPKRSENLFTYHQESGVLAVLSTLIFLIGVETVAAHFLLAKWSNICAWILTGVSLYFLFQLFAHGKAIYLRPIHLTIEKLHIRCGLIGDSVIDCKNIEEIEIINHDVLTDKDSVILSPLGKIITPNLKIFVRKKTVLNGIYGRQTKFKTIFLAIDNAENFTKKIEEIIRLNKIIN